MNHHIRMKDGTLAYISSSERGEHGNIHTLQVIEIDDDQKEQLGGTFRLSVRELQLNQIKV